MDDERLHDLIRNASASWRVPADDPPLDRIWEGVEARAFGPGAVPLRPAARWRMPLAMAAMLIVGLGVGFVAGRGAGPTPSGATDDLPAAVAATPAFSPFVGVATDYLEDATALLVAVAGDLRASGAVPPAVVGRAGELLSTTRLLLDTAPADPALHALLEDLELVLVQVARLPAAEGAPDATLIRQTLDQRDVLPRLTVYLADARRVP